MSIEDRDYYRRRTPTRRKNPSLGSWLFIASVWILAALLLAKAVKHFFPEALERFARPKPRLAMGQAADVPRAGPQWPAPAESPMSARPPSPSRSWSASEGGQPSAAPASPATTTIYRCKAYAGGYFWSTAHCNTQQALVDRMATVPGSLPFDQQVQLAEAQRREAAGLYNQQPPAAVQQATRCAALKIEREAIDARYSNWQWQPLEVINPDQIRMRALREEQARLACPER